MIVQPKVRGFICTNAHPEGCAENVRQQIAYVRNQAVTGAGPQKVLVIGASTGYGLSSRIVSAFGYGASTLGIFFEKPGTATRTGSAGYYNSAAFHDEAQEAGLYAESINGDAFSDDIKQLAIDRIKADLGQVDLVVYSLASPRRTDPSGVTYSSVLKPVGQSVTRKTLDTNRHEVKSVELEPASAQEIASTIKVMGGEDWELWIEALHTAGVLADGCKTVAYTYIGKEITWPLYGHATIGKAKEDLDRAGQALNKRLADIGGEARVAVLKAVVTQASSAIPIMPLYLSLLFRLMKDRDIHEGCIEQAQGLFAQCMYGDSGETDDMQRWRMDSKELDDSIQDAVTALWEQIDSENLRELSDYAGYQTEFLKLFGFSVEGVDYNADVNPEVHMRLVQWP